MKINDPLKLLLGSLVMSCVASSCGSASGTENQVVSSAEPAVLPAPEEDTTSPDDEAEMVMEDKRAKRELTRDGSMYVRSETAQLPLVRFPDGQVSNSDSCAVRVGNKLNRRVPPAYVNGQPVGFC